MPSYAAITARERLVTTIFFLQVLILCVHYGALTMLVSGPCTEPVLLFQVKDPKSEQCSHISEAERRNRYGDIHGHLGLKIMPMQETLNQQKRHP